MRPVSTVSSMTHLPLVDQQSDLDGDENVNPNIFGIFKDFITIFAHKLSQLVVGGIGSPKTGN